MNTSDNSAIIAYLEKAVQTVRDLESQANDAVGGGGGQQKYEDLMRQKAMFLASIADEAEEFEASHPAVFARLERFSSSANSSLSVGSVFFMSALLYPEDHKPGENNDLEALLESLKR